MARFRHLLFATAVGAASHALAQFPSAVLLPTADTAFHEAMLDWSQMPASQSPIEQLHMPVHATRYSSLFGLRHHPILHNVTAHLGVDIPELRGTSVQAAASGIVTFAGWASSYGNLIKIDHGGGSETRYAHLSVINVGVGDMVRQGDRIGAVGSTGRSTGAHLHFEFRDFGRAVDPLGLIDAPIELTPSIVGPIALPETQSFPDGDRALPSPLLRRRSTVLPSCNAIPKRIRAPRFSGTDGPVPS